MKLHELSPPKGAKKARKRVGRGVGSGQGKTAGRGSKGQKSRSGGGVRVGFEGGQMPIQRRLPKRGFTNIFRKQWAVVNVRDLTRFEAGSVVDARAMVDAGLVRSSRLGVKLLAQGEISHPLTVKVGRCSKAAREKIQAAGGIIEVV